MAHRVLANLIARPARWGVVVLFSLCTAGAAGLATAQSSANPDRAKAIAAADAEVRSAQNQLEEARRRFEVGRKASSVDRVNQLEGGGPYTDAYYLRVEALKQDVTKAQERLDRAITARKALDG
jgi:hypothetical protein